MLLPWPPWLPQLAMQLNARLQGMHPCRPRAGLCSCCACWAAYLVLPTSMATVTGDTPSVDPTVMASPSTVKAASCLRHSSSGGADRGCAQAYLGRHNGSMFSRTWRPRVQLSWGAPHMLACSWAWPGLPSRAVLQHARQRAAHYCTLQQAGLRMLAALAPQTSWSFGR